MRGGVKGRKPARIYEKWCLECGASFMAVQKDRAKFCCKLCNANWYNRQMRRVRMAAMLQRLNDYANQ